MFENSLYFTLVEKWYSKLVDLGEPVLEFRIYKAAGEIRGGKLQNINFLEITRVLRVLNTAGFDKMKKRAQLTQKPAGSILSRP